LDASRFQEIQVLNEIFHQLAPVRSTLKSVDGLGAVDTQKRPDLWIQILTLHTECWGYGVTQEEGATLEVSKCYNPQKSDLVLKLT
jgi:hypothetical protein